MIFVFSWLHLFFFQSDAQVSIGVAGAA